MFLLKKLETELKLRGFSQKTLDAYLSHNQDFLNFIKKDFSEASQDNVKEYLAYLMAERKLKPASINLVLSSLKFMYKNVVKKDIFLDIRPPKMEKKLPIVLTKEEIKKLLAVTKNSKHRLLIELMYSSGLRVSECVSLKINDLELSERMATVRSGKGKKDRQVILSDAIVNHLSGYLAERKDENPYVFSVKDRHSEQGWHKRLSRMLLMKQALKKGFSAMP